MELVKWHNWLLAKLAQYEASKGSICWLLMLPTLLRGLVYRLLKELVPSSLYCALFAHVLQLQSQQQHLSFVMSETLVGFSSFWMLLTSLCCCFVYIIETSRMIVRHAVKIVVPTFASMDHWWPPFKRQLQLFGSILGSKKFCTRVLAVWHLLINARPPIDLEPNVAYSRDDSWLVQ